MLTTGISHVFFIVLLIIDGNAESNNNEKCRKYSNSFIFEIYETSCIQADLLVERNAALKMFFYVKNINTDIHLKYGKYIFCYNNMNKGWNLLTHFFEESGLIEVIRIKTYFHTFNHLNV